METANFAQIERYLRRAWYRAGIPVHLHDDCTQAVLVSLLAKVGKNRFESLMCAMNRVPLKDLITLEDDDGRSFLRAVDMVKKRVQRTRVFCSIRDVDELAFSEIDSGPEQFDLREAIASSLDCHEVDLINETMAGRTPSEIGDQWGLSPKTISNQKSLAFRKLRSALVTFA